MTDALKQVWCPLCDQAVAAEILVRKYNWGRVILRLFCPACEGIWEREE